MITVTEAAQEKIASMCLEQNMEAVRPFVMGGGCSGMQHSLTFADKKEKRDTEIAPYLYVDPVAYQFMDGATIDYDKVALGCVVAVVQLRVLAMAINKEVNHANTRGSAKL